jgi:hypothetical protein
MSQPSESAANNPYAAPVPISDAVPLGSAAALPLEGEVRELFNRGKNGAAWFYWIAGLSVINTLMVLSGGGHRFALGLVVTMIADSIGAAIALKPGGNMAALGAAGAFDAVVLGLVVCCGRLSQRRVLPVFAVGMGFYLLDGLLSLLLGGIVGIAIHAYALWSMARGFAAFRQLNALEQRLLMAGAGPVGGQ